MATKFLDLPLDVLQYIAELAQEDYKNSWRIFRGTCQFLREIGYSIIPPGSFVCGNLDAIPNDVKKGKNNSWQYIHRGCTSSIGKHVPFVETFICNDSNLHEYQDIIWTSVKYLYLKEINRDIRNLDYHFPNVTDLTLHISQSQFSDISTVVDIPTLKRFHLHVDLSDVKVPFHERLLSLHGGLQQRNGEIEYTLTYLHNVPPIQFRLYCAFVHHLKLHASYLFDLSRLIDFITMFEYNPPRFLKTIEITADDVPAKMTLDSHVHIIDSIRFQLRFLTECSGSDYIFSSTSEIEEVPARCLNHVIAWHLQKKVHLDYFYELLNHQPTHVQEISIVYPLRIEHGTIRDISNRILALTSLQKLTIRGSSYPSPTQPSCTFFPLLALTYLALELHTEDITRILEYTPNLQHLNLKTPRDIYYCLSFHHLHSLQTLELSETGVPLDFPTSLTKLRIHHAFYTMEEWWHIFRLIRNLPKLRHLYLCTAANTDRIRVELTKDFLLYLQSRLLESVGLVRFLIRYNCIANLQNLYLWCPLSRQIPHILSCRRGDNILYVKIKTD